MKPLNYEILISHILKSFELERYLEYYKFKRLGGHKKDVECELDTFNKRTGVSESSYSYKSLNWEVRLDTYLSIETLRIRKGSKKFKEIVEFSIHRDGDYSKDRIELVQRIGEIMLDAFGN